MPGELLLNNNSAWNVIPPSRSFPVRTQPSVVNELYFNGSHDSATSPFLFLAARAFRSFLYERFFIDKSTAARRLLSPRVYICIHWRYFAQRKFFVSFVSRH